MNRFERVAGDGRELVAAAGDARSVRRLEDVRFLTGKGRYVDDEPRDGQIVMAVLRSPHAHAIIGRIDTAAAAAMPGVRGVFTADDLLNDGMGHMPCSLKLEAGDGLVVPPRFPLCRGRVRHVGDPVAVVLADTPDLAQDALERIEASYEVERPVIDPAHAGDDDAPRIWPEAPGNLAFHYRRGDAAGTQAALALAAHVVELDLVNNRIAAAAMEPRTAIGFWNEATGRYRLLVSGASVHLIRRELAETFGIPLERIDVACPDVGGGFGMKNVTYPEYALVLWAARRLGAPVRWVAERIEDFTGGVHARDNVTKARLALDSDGRFLALGVETIANLGAYASTLGPGSSTTAPTPAMGGLYDIPLVAMDVRGVFTNTAPIDVYRGAGKPEANYVIERLVDLAARRLGMDAAALRRKNLIQALPHVNAMGFTIDSGEPVANLDRALAAADHSGFPARRAEALKRGKLRGIGIGCFLETSRGQPNEEAWIRLTPDGVIVLAVGTQSNGQGHETSFVQLAAERLGLPLETFRLVQGDTEAVPRGGGHGGARSLHMGGTALTLALDDLLHKARPVAARLLQAPIDVVSYRDGAFRTGPDDAARSIDLPELGRVLAASGGDENVEGHGDNICDLYTFPNGCHVAEVEVDQDTGEVRLVSYVAVDDYGTLVNPLLTESQIHGGIAQGVGQALMEHALYDPESGEIVSATFMDYAMPRGADLPNLQIHFVEIPTASNPLGVKGAGQAGAIAAPHTVINAVVDALRPLGIEHVDMPATPQRVWSLMEAARQQS